MTLWQFLKAHSSVSPPRVIVVAGFSGLSNALLLAIVNSGAHAVSTGPVSAQTFTLFVIAIFTYILTQRYVLRVASIEVERIIAKLRVSFADKIRQSDLQSIEGLGRSQLYASVNTDTLTISQATAPMIIASQGAILVLFSLVYIFILSKVAFFMTLAIVGAGVFVHLKNKKDLLSELDRATAKENEFFDLLTHLLEGFKEVKLNAARASDLNARLRDVAAAVAEQKTKTGLRYADYYIFTQVLFYLLIGAMVFILPSLSTVYSEQVTRLTAAILFIIGPLTMVVSAFQVFQSANHAVQSIGRLDAALDRAAALAKGRDRGEPKPPVEFKQIALEQVAFSYSDAEGTPIFTVGPMDLTIAANETTFIVGGNGSGKSTFLKLLAGLYYPKSGTIGLDGVSVKTLGYRSYRELFAAIFSDYHLFDALYGLRNVEDSRVMDLLKMMQLEKKTSWHEGRFVNQELSTGQKKRLALIVALLEDKPIYIFDEWAADQDPGFRQFFYEWLLPELKRRGKTLIVATHDDRYFSVGDRVLKMEFGQIVSETRPTKEDK